MIQRPSSCVTKTPQGGLSVVATEVIENRINPLDSILESSVSPTKRYFSIRTNPLLPFVSTQNAPKKRDIFGGLREKLGLGKTHKSQSTRDKTFEKICFELARADESEAGSENAQMFEMDELALKINIIDGKSFNLVLPPAMDVLASCDVDTEEGVGGSCDLFIGMLPNSCKKVSEKASPLGLVPKLLPHGVISKEARYVGSCFWIWLCIVDGRWPWTHSLFERTHC